MNATTKIPNYFSKLDKPKRKRRTQPKRERTKKNKRRKSVLENAGVKKVTKKPTKAMMKFCQVCHKSSHVANECWELEKNADKCPVNWKSVLTDLKDAWDMLTSNGGDDNAASVELQEGTAD